MIIGGVLAIAAAVAIIVGVVMHNNAKAREEASVAALSSDLYRKLYSLKDTGIKEEDKIVMRPKEENILNKLGIRRDDELNEE